MGGVDLKPPGEFVLIQPCKAQDRKAYLGGMWEVDDLIKLFLAFEPFPKMLLLRGLSRCLLEGSHQGGHP